MHVVNHESREKHDFPHIKQKTTLHIKGHVIIILINIVNVLFYFGFTAMNTVNILFLFARNDCKYDKVWLPSLHI